MHPTGKILIKTCLKGNRDVIFLSNRKGKFKLLGLQENSHPSPQFPRLVRHPDLPLRRILKVVGLLTVMIFFQNKTFTACKVKDEKEETVFK